MEKSQLKHESDQQSGDSARGFICLENPVSGSIGYGGLFIRMEGSQDWTKILGKSEKDKVE